MRFLFSYSFTCVLVFGSSLLSGCISTSEKSPGTIANSHSNVQFLPQIASAQMAIAEPGSTFELDQSVWELGTSVTVHRRYFAASGQNCLSISVALPAGEESAVVCEYKQGLWGVSRAITEPQVNR